MYVYRWRVKVILKEESKFKSFSVDFQELFEAEGYAISVCHGGYSRSEVMDGERTYVPPHHVLEVDIEKLYPKGGTK